MSLSDLPLEIFRQIVCDAVYENSDRDISYSTRNVACIASVHSAFEREVFELLDKDNFLLTSKAIPDNSWEWDEITITFLTRYVERIPHNQTTPFFKHFPALTNHVIEKIATMAMRNGDESILDARSVHVKTLCRWACKDFTQPSNRHGLLLEHVFVAAIYLGQNRICINNIALCFCRSGIWGRPLLAAIRTENVPLIRLLLERGVRPDTSQAWDKSLDLTAIVHAKAAEMILSLFALPHWNVEWSRLALEDALKLAIKLEKIAVAHILLYIDRKNGINTWTSTTVLKYLSETCKLEMNELSLRFNDIMDDKLVMWPNNYSETRAHVLDACATGEERELQKLISEGANIHGEIYDHPLIMSATKKGHIGILRVLLDAGETLNSVQAVKILREAAPRSRASGAIWYLLRRKAIELNKLDRAYCVADTHLAHLITFAIQAGNIHYIEALVHFGVSLDNDELFDEGNCTMPLVTATTFRQESMTRRLQELGAKENSHERQPPYRTNLEIH